MEIKLLSSKVASMDTRLTQNVLINSQSIDVDVEASSCQARSQVEVVDVDIGTNDSVMTVDEYVPELDNTDQNHLN